MHSNVIWFIPSLSFLVSGVPLPWLISGGVFAVLLVVFVAIEASGCCRGSRRRHQRAEGEEDTELLISTPSSDDQHATWRERLGAAVDLALFKVCPVLRQNIKISLKCLLKLPPILGKISSLARQVIFAVNKSITGSCSKRKLNPLLIRLLIGWKSLVMLFF